MIDLSRQLSWKELPKGDYLDPGTATEFQTGDWRNKKPIWNKEKCIQCLMCWIYCPDTSLEVKDGKVTGINYKHCKGCGICAKVCPPKANAIEIVDEYKVEGLRVKGDK